MLAMMACLALLPVSPRAPDPYVLSDFDTGEARGWYAYEETEGVIEVTPAPDAAVGDGAVRVRYTQAGRWGYWDRPIAI